MKKMLSALLAVLMVLSMFPLSMLAEELESVEEVLAETPEGEDVLEEDEIAPEEDKIAPKTEPEIPEEDATVCTEAKEDLLSADLEVVASGYCGGDTNAVYNAASEAYENLWWEITSDGTLTIGGTGAMRDYFIGDSPATPWEKYFCYNDGKLVIEDGVTTIGTYAFYHNRGAIDVVGLTGNLVFPESITAIGQSAFEGCSGFTGNLIIPKNVTNIGKSAFTDFGKVESISVSDDNPYYSSEDGILYNKNQTVLIAGIVGENEALIIPESVISIEDYAFYCCNKYIGDLVIPENVVSIGSLAFNGSDFEVIYFKGNAPTVGDYAFNDSAVLYYSADKTGWSTPEWNGYETYQGEKAFELPDNAIDGGWCGKGTNLWWVLDDEGTLTIDGTGEMRDYSYVQKYSEDGSSYRYTTSAPWESYRKQIARISITEGVTTIGDYAFDFNPSLIKFIELPESITLIGSYAFYNFSFATYNQSLMNKRICFWGNAPSVEDHAFFDRTVLYHLEGKNGWTSPTWNGYSTDIWDGTIVFASGFCGADESTEYNEDSNAYKNLSWKIDYYGALTISGEGEMRDYDYESAPWENYDYIDYIIKIVISDGVTKIGNNAFYEFNFNDCTLELADSIETIGNNAFYYAKTDGELILPKNLKTIGEMAFAYYKSNFDPVTIPEGVETIGMGAFAFTGFSGFSLPKSVVEIGEGAFMGNPQLESIFVSEENQNYCSVDGILYNKNRTVLIAYPLGKEGPILILDGIETIAAYTFAQYMGSIRDVVIPAGVTDIGEYAFWGSAFEEYYFMGDAPSVIPKNGDCPSFSDTENNPITIYYDATKSGWSTPEWNGYTAYPGKEFELPVGAVDGGWCGNEGTNLWWALANDGTLTIGGEGEMRNYDEIYFENHDSNAPWIVYKDQLTKLVIEKGVTTLGSYAFKNCSGFVGALEIPEGVEIIGLTAFGNCTGLVNVSVPESVEVIETNAFRGCTNLKSISVPEKNEYYSSRDGVLYDKEQTVLILCPEGKTGEVTIPRTVEVIGDYAFRNCFKLSGNLVLPDTVAIIGAYAFYCCTVSDGTIVLSEGVTEIGGYAFRGCSVSSKSLVIPESVSIIGKDTFSHNYLEKVYFMGNAPEFFSSGLLRVILIVDGCPDSSPLLYYLEGKNDWTSPVWNGYQTALWVMPDDGDVNADGSINVLDANIVRRAAAKLIMLTDSQNLAADVNGDGSINVIDANLIRRYAAKLITEFPA